MGDLGNVSKTDKSPAEVNNGATPGWCRCGGEWNVDSESMSVAHSEPHCADYRTLDAVDFLRRSLDDEDLEERTQWLFRRHVHRRRAPGVLIPEAGFGDENALDLVVVVRAGRHAGTLGLYTTWSKSSDYGRVFSADTTVALRLKPEDTRPATADERAAFAVQELEGAEAGRKQRAEDARAQGEPPAGVEEYVAYCFPDGPTPQQKEAAEDEATTKEDLARGLTELTLDALVHQSPGLVAVALMRFAAVSHLTGGGSSAAFEEMARSCYKSEQANRARTEKKE